MPITVSHEDKMYNRITLMIRSEKIYPPPPGEVFDNLIRNTINYAEKYMNDCDFDSNKLNIYMNDEGYWEKVITRKKRDMDTIYLPKKDKDLLITDINRFLDPDTKARYDSLGRTHKRVYLFEGLPGSGKTSFIAALASMIDYDIATITFTDKVTDGTLMRLIKNIPEKTFLVLEDIDVLFTDRKKNDGHKNQVTFSGILNSLDGITTKDGFICFMTTNYKNQLDSALLRPGRIDKQLEFKYANKEQIHTMFTKFMADGYTPEKFTEFYDKFKELNVEVTMSLIQEYMFKYLDDPESAIKNVDEIKMLHTTCITDKQGELYT
jgi:chaperone BCS1